MVGLGPAFERLVVTKTDLVIATFVSSATQRSSLIVLKTTQFFGWTVS